MAAGNTLAHLGWPGQAPAQPPLLADVGLTNDALLRDPRSLRPSDQRQHERLMSTRSDFPPVFSLFSAVLS